MSENLATVESESTAGMTVAQAAKAFESMFAEPGEQTEAQAQTDEAQAESDDVGDVETDAEEQGEGSEDVEASSESDEDAQESEQSSRKWYLCCQSKRRTNFWIRLLQYLQNNKWCFSNLFRYSNYLFLIF